MPGIVTESLNDAVSDPNSDWQVQISVGGKYICEEPTFRDRDLEMGKS